MKATEKVDNASMVPTSGSSDGKKSLPNTNADAIPKQKNSYHSRVVPSRPEKSALLAFAASCPFETEATMSLIPSLCTLASHTTSCSDFHHTQSSTSLSTYMSP